MSSVLGAIRARVRVREPRHLPVFVPCFAGPRYDFELEGAPMTATQLADLVEKQIGLWRRNLSQQAARPVTANDLISIISLLSNICDAVKALDTGKAQHG
jgi:hypothetical protein